MIIRNTTLVVLLATLVLPARGVAHDLWVETNVAVVQQDESIDVAFKLGNCNRGQRTFRTSGLLDLAGVTTFEIKPDGKRHLVQHDLVRSSEDESGYWTMAREMKTPGLTWFCQTLDQAIEHDGKRMRGLVSGKAFVLTVPQSRESPELKADAAIGFPLELILQTTAVPSVDRTSAIRVQLLLNGKPLRRETVSFLPHSIDPQKTAVEDFERKTGEDGVAEFLARRPGLYLISARHSETNNVEGDPIYYSTTLTLRVNRHEVSR